MEEYGLIIVGAGTAECVLAGRLSAGLQIVAGPCDT